MSEVTRILSAIERGDRYAAEQLLPLVYDELRKLASAKMVREKPGHTLQATALVHEAYLRLLGPFRSVDCPEGLNRALEEAAEPMHWNSRGHFFAAAAEAMRRILIEQARQRQAAKRGGGRVQADFVDVAAPEALSPYDLIALNEALDRLTAERPQHATLVKLRFFGGLPLEECANCLGISLATAKRHWTFARAWLFGELADTPHREELP
jgi:RNA polymerase sigma factor (sigma-70 family)